MTPMTMTKTGEKAVTIKRRFNAGPEAVYKTHLNVDMLTQWMLGPEGWTMPHCELDPTPGGAFSYTWEEAASGERFTIRGTIKVLDPPSRIEHVEVMEMPGMVSPESHVVTEFAADGDGTLMTMTITYDSAESREGAIASGMEDGMAVSYDNLDRMVSA